jgi:hypothetical protein
VTTWSRKNASPSYIRNHWRSFIRVSRRKGKWVRRTLPDESHPFRNWAVPVCSRLGGHPFSSWRKHGASSLLSRWPGPPERLHRAIAGTEKVLIIARMMRGYTLLDLKTQAGRVIFVSCSNVKSAGPRRETSWHRNYAKANNGRRDARHSMRRQVFPPPALFTRSCYFHHELSTTSSATRATKSL